MVARSVYMQFRQRRADKRAFSGVGHVLTDYVDDLLLLRSELLRSHYRQNHESTAMTLVNISLPQ